MKKSILSAILSGILLSLPNSSGNLWVLAWFGFVPLFLALEGNTLKQAFILFFITGLVFWTGTVYWLVYVTLIGTIALIIYLALYFALFGLIIRPCTKCSTPLALIFIPSVWVLLEYVRGHLFSGFPWALLGYSQYLNLPVIQIADTTGAWGVSFLVVMINVAVYLVVRRPSSVVRLKVILLCAFCLLGILLYGFYRLNEIRNTKYERRFKISVIQGNIPQEFKWDPAANEFIMGEYIGLSAQAARGRPDLIVWPEAAFPVVLEEEPVYYQRAQDFAASTGVPLLLGAVTERQGNYYNSAVLVRGGEAPEQRYDKLHRVPFGEYIPLKNILPFLRSIVPIGDIAAGQDHTVFSLPLSGSGKEVKFSVLVCFEDVFPELSRDFVNRGADFLVNVTNDAWYKETSAPYQHLQASVLRAVENRVSLARSANTGISACIAPSGKIISLLRDSSGKEIFVRGFITQDILIAPKKPSFYGRFGEWFILLCAAIAIFSAGRQTKKV